MHNYAMFIFYNTVYYIYMYIYSHHVFFPRADVLLGPFNSQEFKDLQARKDEMKAQDLGGDYGLLSP